MFANAGALLSSAPVRDRLINLLIRAQSEAQMGQPAAASAHFQAAVALAHSEGALAAVDDDFYREGLEHAARSRVQADHPAQVGVAAALQLRDAGDLGRSADAWLRTEQLATEAGDIWLALRARVNLVAVLADADDRGGALEHGRRALGAARRHGLARFAAMAAGTLASVIGAGADDMRGAAERLLLLVESAYLSDLHDRHQAELSLGDNMAGADDPSAVHGMLGLLAKEYGDLETAVEELAAGVEGAVQASNLNGEALRRANLISVLRQREAEGGTDRAGDDSIAENAGALEALIKSEHLGAPNRQIAKVALHAARRWNDAEEQIASLQAIGAGLESIRATLPPGPARAAVESRYGAYPQLRVALESAGRDHEAWQVLQELRARDLLEEVSVRSGDPDGYQPPTLDEAAELLSGTAHSGRDPSVLVDVVATPAGLRAYVLDSRAELQVVDVGGGLDDLNAALGEQGASASRRLVELVSSNRLLTELATEVSRLTENADLLICVDDWLANLPWPSVAIGGRRWNEVQRVGRLPAVGLLGFGEHRWTGKSYVAGDSLGDLPGARGECVSVAQHLGGSAVLGADCSLQTFVDSVTNQSLDFLHLAVHGFADEARGGRSTLVLAAPDGRAHWVRFDDLATVPWSARVVVFSGCSTAVGGPRHGSGLYGISQAAMANGAKTVVASLWPVSDVAARAFMVAMYTDVVRQLETGSADIRLALRHASEGASGAPAGLGTSRTRDMRELVVRPRPGEDRHPASEPAARVGDAFVVMGDPVIRR